MNTDRNTNKIAIDLLWVRPGKVGGTEVYIRNLLDGFLELTGDFHFVLLVSKDNADTFSHYTKDSRFELLIANTVSANIGGRIIWQYLHQNRFLKKNGLTTCFVPVYCRPFFNGGITYINTIHDIQAYHFPKYHPFHENFYSFVTWFAASKFSRYIITTSEYVKEDIVKNFGFKEERITVLPIPVIVDKNETVPFEELAKRYDIEKDGYYYTVSQNIPHKNFVTLIKVIAEIKKRQEKSDPSCVGLPTKLLVSGISGNASGDVSKLIDELDVRENIIQTGYISNAEKNTLTKNAKAFLFPSYFEGFGIPPVEAMILGQRVITTIATSIPEVTLGKAEYVEDYLNPEAWIEVMVKGKGTQNDSNGCFLCYEKNNLAERYLKMLKSSVIDNN